MSDGAGLCLLVQPNGSKWWRLRYKWTGREQMLSLGTYPDTPLATARQRREEARQALAQGINPAAVRRAAEVMPERSFAAVGRHWLCNLERLVGRASDRRKRIGR
ncbi:MAG: DUF4102 domain-containing protein, partial [Sinobacteraceae bacterium]|nr:DUF4102 domain-containing protein [Nevskiaceae bacterium]